MKRGKTILNLYSNILLVSSVGARKEVKIFPFQLSKWTFAVQIIVKKEKMNR